MIQSQINIKLNISQYVQKAFGLNQDTFQSATEEINITQSFIIKNPKDFKGNELDKVVWVFRKLQTTKDCDRQHDLISKKSHNTRHLFLFLLTLIHHESTNEKKIISLMKSIGIKEKKSVLELIIDEKEEMSQIKYFEQDIIQQKDINQEDYQNLIKYWVIVKEETPDKIDQIFEMIKNNKQSRIENIILFANFQLNSNRFKQLEKMEKQRSNQRKKPQIVEQESDLLNQKQYIQKSVIHQIKIQYCKVKISKQKELILFPNGNIGKMKCWKSLKNDKTPIMPYLFDVEIIQLRKSQFTLNELFGDQEIVNYQGQINFQFQPNNFGILTNGDKTMRYEGGFKNGLFHKEGKIFQQQQLQYVGTFVNGQKHGQFYRFYEINKNNQEIFLQGHYNYGRREGVFEDFIRKQDTFQKIGKYKLYYSNGVLVQSEAEIKQQLNSNFKPSTALFNFRDFGVNNYIINSILPGSWLNANVVDILLRQYQNLMTQRVNHNSNFYNIYINCSLFQDIFGSIITEDAEINYDEFEQYLKQNNNVYKDQIRIIFYFNLDRGHFLSVVYENQKLYLIDSFTDIRRALLFQIRKLLNKFGFKVNDYWENFEISQQENGYDCGVYTIYYMRQMIKYSNLSIEELKKLNSNRQNSEKQFGVFKVEQREINIVRFEINQWFFGNGTSKYGM